MMKYWTQSDSLQGVGQPNSWLLFQISNCMRLRGFEVKCNANMERVKMQPSAKDYSWAEWKVSFVSVCDASAAAICSRRMDISWPIRIHSRSWPTSFAPNESWTPNLFRHSLGNLKQILQHNIKKLLLQRLRHGSPGGIYLREGGKLFRICAHTHVSTTRHLWTFTMKWNTLRSFPTFAWTISYTWQQRHQWYTDFYPFA